MNVKTNPSSINGVISVPGSKSHTIRACLFASLSEGVSVIKNPLPSEDCLSALRLIKQFGATVKQKENEWIIEGIGNKWPQLGEVIDVGNSGTLMHFIAGIVSTIKGYSVITGDSSICKRPIEQQLIGLRQLGAEAFTTRENIDAPPVIIRGPIHSGVARITGELSQHVSGILIGAALTEGKTRIELTNPKELPFLKMTIDWLSSVGITVEYDKEKYSWLEIVGPNKFDSFQREIPSDWEGVAFPLAAAILTNSNLKINNLDFSDSQGDKVIVEVFQKMGGNIKINPIDKSLTVTGGNKLHGISLNCSDFPDALPMLSVVAAFSEGTSRFYDIGICRLKETDRITLMKRELEKLGAVVTEGDTYLEVQGGNKLHGGEVESYKDHRIAMAMAVCGMALKEDHVVVKDAECCSVSFPNFYKTMNTIGANFTIE